MTRHIRICQLLDWQPVGGARVRAQNFFVGETFIYEGRRYEFVPFQTSGTLATLSGDNEQLTCLFPNRQMIVRLVEGGDGNRNSELTLTNLWLNRQNQPLPGAYPEYYVGVGASFSDTTVELRFRSTMDSVNSVIPYRIITAENTGVLPLDSQISLR